MSGPNPLENVKPSPRVKLAARLYATGAVRTKKEASVAAGLHPNYLTMLTSPNGGSHEVKRLVNDIDKMIEDKTVDTSAILDILGRKAVGKLAHLMESQNEHVALKAATDLADRATATSKTQKLQVEAFSISGQDAKELAAALVESAKTREQYLHAAHGLVEIDVAQRPELPAYAQEQANVKEAADTAKAQKE